MAPSRRRNRRRNRRESDWGTYNGSHQQGTQGSGRPHPQPQPVIYQNSSTPSWWAGRQSNIYGDGYVHRLQGGYTHHDGRNYHTSVPISWQQQPTFETGTHYTHVSRQDDHNSNRVRSRREQRQTVESRTSRATAGFLGHSEPGSWSVWKNCSYDLIESRMNMFCHNCKRKHPPELCRGPLDHRGLLNFCGFCGRKHLIDDCRQLKDLSPLSQGLWKKYIIFESRRGLAPFATRKGYDMSNFHGGLHLDVLNPKVAKWWETQVVVYDQTAGRLPYWRRFDWNSHTLKPTVDLFDRLPYDPTIPPHFQNTGPPSHIAPKPTDVLMQWRTPAAYLHIGGLREDELDYDPYWLLFESGPRTLPDTGQSIMSAQVRLSRITGQRIDSFHTRLDWPEPMAMDI
ncbi:hypothetical protein PG991_010169 [Apiospora marii]|uniref:Uncharacterized protein n=1 Tax=Apiospora marii TaxID=335849 RepID=A0ABR1RHN0_9PEZI